MPHPDSDPRSDAALLTAHVAGDRQAFGALFTRHRPRLYRLARARSRTAEDAEDLVQEAMLGALRTARHFRYDSAVGSWLYQIVVNACADRRRRDTVRPAPGPLDESQPMSDQHLRVETAMIVRAALLRLPVGQRAAILAVDMHGYTVSDAARLLGVAEGTIKSRRARARGNLAVLLRPPGPA
ncbi:MAG TPA: RNA polymerase sigma factor SigM [Mycobacterium sp.]|nr:RNA polymerase sigma factor SigM [Mycobacterium sp.]HQE14643.1 RNA polymerase sigma factor SigM [Mycobacterium sp.]